MNTGNTWYINVKHIFILEETNIEKKSFIPHNNNNRNIMTELHWGRQQLFMYSLDDPLCNASKLTELIEDKEKRCVSCLYKLN